MCNEVKLPNKAVLDIPLDHLQCKVSDYVTSDGQWRWGEFAHFLPVLTVMKVASMHLPVSQDSADTIRWCMSANGDFSVKSTVELKTKCQLGHPNRLWNLIWK